MADSSAQLQHALEWCAQHNIRLTAQRQAVLTLIVEHQGAITAYELLDRLKETVQQAKPPTIYRALDFLLAHKLIHKIESINRYVACCLLDHANHCSQLLICDTCGSVTEHHNDTLNQWLNSSSQETGFHVHHHVIETHGQCAQCHSKSTPCCS